MINLISLLTLPLPLVLCSELEVLKVFSWSFESVLEAGRGVDSDVVGCMSEAAEDFWNRMQPDGFLDALKTCQEGEQDSEEEEISRSSALSDSSLAETGEGKDLDDREKLYYVFFKEAYKQRAKQQVLLNVEGPMKLASRWLSTPEEDTTFLLGLSEQVVREWKPRGLQKRVGRAKDSLLGLDQFWTFAEFFQGLNENGWLAFDDTMPLHLLRLFLLELRLEDEEGIFEAWGGSLVSRVQLVLVFLGLEMLPFLPPPQKNILFLEMLRLGAQSRSLPLLKALLDRKGSFVGLHSFRQYQEEQAENPPLHNFFGVLQLIESQAKPEQNLLDMASFFAWDRESFTRDWVRGMEFGALDSFDDVLEEYEAQFSTYSADLKRRGAKVKLLGSAQEWEGVPLVQSVLMSTYTFLMERFEELREGGAYEDLVPYFRTYGGASDAIYLHVMEGLLRDGGVEEEDDFLGIANLIEICNSHLVLDSARVDADLLAALGRASNVFQLDQAYLFPFRVLAAFVESVGKRALEELIDFAELHPHIHSLPPHMSPSFRALSDSVLDNQLLLQHVLRGILQHMPHLLGVGGPSLFSSPFVYDVVTQHLKNRKRVFSASRALSAVRRAFGVVSRAGVETTAATGSRWVGEREMFFADFMVRCILGLKGRVRGLEGIKGNLKKVLIPKAARSGSPSFPISESRQGEVVSEVLTKALAYRYLFCSSSAHEPACLGYSDDEKAQGWEVIRVLLIPAGETGEWILESSPPLFLSGVQIEPEEARGEARALAVRWGLLDSRVGELPAVPSPGLDELRRAADKEEEELRVGPSCNINDETWEVLID